MQQVIERMLEEGLAKLAQVHDLAELDALRVRYLGKKGELTSLLRGLGAMSAAERPAAGAALNVAKERLAAAIAERRERLQDAALAAPAELDVTLPGLDAHAGSLHPLPQVVEEICDIFYGMGYSRASGPEVELDALNFTALNFPDDHPSRDLQDTFYVSDQVVLRTQTSPVQIRTMRERRPPLAIVAPGRVYRQEQPDASHAAEFWQIEGLFVDHDVSLADLRATVDAFVRAFYGEAKRLRFRPHFFPFTEPSVEVDLWWESGSKSGWLEIMGAGMVHPHVFANCGYEPDRYTGFAFGMGIDRIAMVRHGIPDIRLFLENDLRFLRQFRGGA
jgi:phenylalanyl-tRNA synthetase alpha chain